MYVCVCVSFQKFAFCTYLEQSSSLILVFQKSTKAPIPSPPPRKL